MSRKKCLPHPVNSSYRLHANIIIGNIDGVKVVALPDLRLSFYCCGEDLIADDYEETIRASGKHPDVAVSLAKTIEIMEDMIDRTCERYDMTNNLADIEGNVVPRRFQDYFSVDDSDDLPF